MTRRAWGRLMRLSAGAVAAATILLVSGCAEPPDGSDRGEARVRVAVDSFTLGTQSFVGIEKGYFADQGIAVTPQTYSTGTAALDAVLGGQADIAPALDFATMSRLGTGRLRILGGVANPEPGFHELAVRGDIASAEDLRGKRIGYVPGTAEEYVTVNYLKIHDIPRSQVTLSKFDSIFELVNALKADRIDATWLWGQGLDKVKSDSDIKILFDDRKAQAGGPTIFLVATTAYAKKHQAELVKVIKGMQRASTFIQSDTEGAAAIGAEYVHGDAEVIAATLPDQHFRLGMTDHDLQRLRSLQTFGKSSGAFEVPEEISKYVQLDAMKKAIPDKVTVTVK